MSRYNIHMLNTHVNLYTHSTRWTLCNPNFFANRLEANVGVVSLRGIKQNKTIQYRVLQSIGQAKPITMTS